MPCILLVGVYRPVVALRMSWYNYSSSCSYEVNKHWILSPLRCHPLLPLTARGMRICKYAWRWREFTLDFIFQGDAPWVISICASFSFPCRQAARVRPCQEPDRIIHEECDSSQSGEEKGKVALFQLARLNCSVESNALAWLQFLSVKLMHREKLTLHYVCKSNFFVLIDSARSTEPAVWPPAHL